jgi:PAS domain S-box-containing protein
MRLSAIGLHQLEEWRKSMSEDGEKPQQVETLLSTPDLAGALESEQFRRFLDQVPIAIIVSEMKDAERVVYANPEFEKLSGLAVSELEGGPWSILKGVGNDNGARRLGEAIVDSSDLVGTFKIERAGQDVAIVDAYSNVIESDDGKPCYRLAALVDIGAHGQQREEFERTIREKDILLREVQHRVKNNLQMIVALMRIEARNARGRMDTGPFERLAGRIESIGLLYALLADRGTSDEIDLGVYLGKIASSVFTSHAVEGIRLDLKVDAYPVSVNVALPTGLVVNELLTNALKHAFVGRDSGTVTLNSLSDGAGCRVVIADNGVGLPEGAVWPKGGKLSALIVQSLRENARARVDIESSPAQGTRTTIVFTRSAAAPQPME